MKKIITLLTFAACLFIAIPASSQIRFGVKVGTNLPQNTFKDLYENSTFDGFKIKNSTGFFLGPTLDIRIPFLGFSVDAGVNYSMRRYSMEHEYNGFFKDKKNSQHMLEVPINIKYTFKFGDLLGVYLAAGPAFGFNLNAGSFWDDLQEISGGVFDGKGGEYTRRNAEIALNFGFGVLLLDHVQIGANYNMALTDDAKASGKDFFKESWSGNAVKNRMWQLSIAYMF